MIVNDCETAKERTYQKPHKITVIAKANTIGYPRTVVIKIPNASTTNIHSNKLHLAFSTVKTAGRNVILAIITEENIML